MRDIHAHIIPGVDDGAADMESALAMAELALSGGVTAVCATSHCGFPGQDIRSFVERYVSGFTALQKNLNSAGIALKLYPGMEIFGTMDTAGLLQDEILKTLNGSRYPLIEFPFVNFAPEATEILADVIELGLRPIVAHPERYRYVQTNPALLNRWTEMGCLFQINRGSLLGRFGRSAEQMAFSMVGRGYVCAVASDAHSPTSRTTWMRDVRELLSEEFSPELANSLLEENPRLILENKDIPMNEPQWF